MIGRTERFLVIGAGNPLRSDDGIGIHIAQSLMKDPPPETLVLDVGTNALNAISYMEEADRVLWIDAIQAGETPGTIRAFFVREIEAPAPLSAHHLDLRAALISICRRIRSPILCVGIEPESLEIGWGLSLTARLAAPLLEAKIRACLREMRSGGVHEAPQSLIKYFETN